MFMKRRLTKNYDADDDNEDNVDDEYYDGYDFDMNFKQIIIL